MKCAHWLLAAMLPMAVQLKPLAAQPKLLFNAKLDTIVFGSFSMGLWSWRCSTHTLRANKVRERPRGAERPMSGRWSVGAVRSRCNTPRLEHAQERWISGTDTVETSPKPCPGPARHPDLIGCDQR